MVVEIANLQTSLKINAALLKRAVKAVLTGEAITKARVSVAVVDDAAIHELNRRHLGHDYPTDVLSFLLEREEDWLEGEIVVSADTAVSQGKLYHAAPADELLLYVVHAALHLAGYDDGELADRRVMRRLERRYLEQLGVTVRWRRGGAKPNAKPGKLTPKSPKKPGKQPAASAKRSG